jgi:hypothetical protein
MKTLLMAFLGLTVSMSAQAQTSVNPVRIMDGIYHEVFQDVCANLSPEGQLDICRDNGGAQLDESVKDVINMNVVLSGPTSDYTSNQLVSKYNFRPETALQVAKAFEGWVKNLQKNDNRTSMKQIDVLCFDALGLKDFDALTKIYEASRNGDDDSFDKHIKKVSDKLHLNENDARRYILDAIGSR